MKKLILDLRFWFGCSILLLTVVPFYLYFHKVCQTTCEFSKSQEWANFGTYVGGVLGPLYALFAFSAALLALRFQARESGKNQTRAYIEEIQNLAFSLSGKIDELLKTSITLENGNASNLGMVLTAACHQKRKPDLYENQFAVKVAELHEYEFNVLIIEFNQLVKLLEYARGLGASAAVDGFYRNRYRVAVCELDFLGLLPVGCSSYLYFDPPQVRKEVFTD